MYTFQYDISQVEEKQQREVLNLIARTAEAAERYEDMSLYMEKLVDLVTGNGTDLTTEERNLLSVAFKNVIGARRASWRSIFGTAADRGQSGDTFDAVLQAYKTQVEKELDDICVRVLNILEEKLIPNGKKCGATEEALVFYLKMAGDYYRYRAEPGNSNDYDNKSADFYKQAYDTAKDHLEATHPIRLGLALNYSVCYYEILKDKAKACELAKNAFDEAISQLDNLPEASYKDSTLIMQLLRDNLTLWTSTETESENEEGEV